MMKLCAIVAVFSVVLCVTQAAPVQPDETSVFLSEIERENYAFRTLLERWINGDIGLRKSLKDLAGLIRGTKSMDEIAADIKLVFGSFSATARGLILLLRNAGVNAFHGFLSKILGRDYVPVTPKPPRVQYVD